MKNKQQCVDSAINMSVFSLNHDPENGNVLHTKMSGKKCLIKCWQMLGYVSDSM